MSGALVSGLVAVATVLVFAASIAALVLPLVRRPAPRAARAGDEQETRVGALLEEREAALLALRELDDDYAVGKLAEADYHAVRERYELRALALLKAADVLGAGPAAGPAVAPRSLADGLVIERTRARDILAGPGGPPAVHRNGTAATHASGPRPGPRAGSRAGSGTSAAGALARRGRGVAVGATAAALLFLAGVAALYVVGSRGQSVQRPVATLEGIGPRALVLAPGEPRRAYLATAAGLWTSDDAGATWQQARGLDGALRAVAVSPARPGRVYAAGPGTVAVSDDAGRSWDARPLPEAGGGPSPLALSRGEPGPRASPPGTGERGAGQADIRALAVHPGDADRVWVVVEGAGVYRSDDGARTWQRTSAQAPPNATALVVLPGDPGAAQGGAAGVLLYLASATEGVQASADEGRAWSPASGVLSGALPSQRVSALAFDAASGDTATTPDGRTLRGTLYVGTDQGVFRSVDRGQTWGRLSLAAAVAAVAAGGAPGGGLLLAVDREGQVYRSQSRGVTWDGS